MLIVVTGPIASGKTTLSRAVARTLRMRSVTTGLIDLDEVYELIDDRGPTAGDIATWDRARRLVGAFARELLADGVQVVVVEGSFDEPEERRALLGGFALPTDTRFVTLRSTIEVALDRVEGDPERGISRVPAFLRRHYDLPRTEHGTDLEIDTTATSVDDAVANVVGWAFPLGVDSATWSGR